MRYVKKILSYHYAILAFAAVKKTAREVKGKRYFCYVALANFDAFTNMLYFCCL